MFMKLFFHKNIFPIFIGDNLVTIAVASHEYLLDEKLLALVCIHHRFVEHCQN